MKTVVTFLTITLLVACLFGCGVDDVEDNGSVADPPQDEDNQIPTITIEKIRSEKVDRGIVILERVWWRLNASPAPKTDLAVMGSFGSSDWVIIPKSLNSSEEFSNTADDIQIRPLPMVSIVGKGVMVNLEKLQRDLPARTRGGHIIPKDYDFPLYKVGEPSKLVVEGELHGLIEAEFQSSIPPDGGELRANGTLLVTFRGGPPENVTINGKPCTVKDRTARLAGPHAGDGPTPFNITWDNGPGGVAGSATITLNMIQPDRKAPTIAKKNFGQKDVDPAPLNKDGVVIEFSEPIAVHSLKLTLEDGTNLGWAPRVDGARVTFKPLRGKELVNETTYVVQGVVKDAAGNRTDVKVTFVTGSQK